MGKTKSQKEMKARMFVLKVAMHCTCDGCMDKIRAAVKDITRHDGIESWDQSAVQSKGELLLVATADPEKLRQRLHKATRKQVDLVFPGTNKNKDKDKAGGKAAADAATMLLNTLQQQQQGHGGQSAWAANPLIGGIGYGAAVPAQAAYPWAAVPQQADPYAAYSFGGSGGWGAYPPVAFQGHGAGAYYGGAWHGY